MKNQNYKIDWTNNTITMTKKFAEEANQYGTTAYNLLMDVRSKGFQVVVRKAAPRKACPSRMTFRQMEIYLSCLTNPDERLAQLHTVMAESKSQTNPYEHVRKWFNQNYPNFTDIPVLDSNNRIIASPVKLLPAEITEVKISA